MDRSSLPVRRDSDGGRLRTEFSKSLPDSEGRAEASMLEALQSIEEAEKNTEEETKLAEVERILKDIISMSRKYSQSEAVLTFLQTPSFESSQSFSPVTVADIWRANGFCLANTETILYDAFLSKENEKSPPVHPKGSQVLTRSQKRHEHGFRCNEEATLNSIETGMEEQDHTVTKLQSYNDCMSFLQLEACETDILE